YMLADSLLVVFVVLAYIFTYSCFFFFQAEDGIRDDLVTGVQTCALPISIVGVWGLWLLSKPGNLTNAFIDPREHRPYIAAFLGLLLTAFGSAYYHLAPSNAHLVWDRLPMAIVFGSLVAVIITERISVEAGLKLLPFLVAIAAGSVLQWYGDELHGR